MFMALYYLQGWGVGAGAPYPNIFCVKMAECWNGGKYDWFWCVWCLWGGPLNWNYKIFITFTVINKNCEYYSTLWANRYIFWEKNKFSEI